MSTLNDLFTNVTVELIEPCDSDSRYLRSLRLLLRDNASGALTELTIEADMLTMPDEAVLVWSAMGVDERAEDLAGWWWKAGLLGTTGDINSYHSLAPVTQAEPGATWIITPDGQEVELRGGGEGGLF